MNETLTLWNTPWELTANQFLPANPATVPLDPAARLELRDRVGTSGVLWADLQVVWTGNRRLHLLAQVDLTLAGTVWSVRPGARAVLWRARIGEPRTPDDLLTVGLGGLHFHSATAYAVVVADDLEIHTRDGSGGGTLLLGAPLDEQPLLLTTDRVAFRLDLAGRRLRFAENSFSGRVATIYETKKTGIRTVHRTALRSAAAAIPLDCADDDPVDLTFAPSPTDALQQTQRLFLNLEIEDRLRPIDAGPEDVVAGQLALPGPNNLTPALELLNAVLVVRLQKSLADLPALPGGRPYLARLLAAPSAGATTIEVVCHGTSDETDNPCRVSVPELHLRARIGSPRIADTTNMPGLVAAAGRVSAAASKEIHGVVPGIWGQMLDGASGLELSGMPVHRDAAAERLGRTAAVLPKSLQIPATDQTHPGCYENLATLVRRGADASTVHAAFEVSLREVSPALATAATSPVRFTGSEMRWPMLNVDRLRRLNWQFGAPQSEPAKKLVAPANPVSVALESLNDSLASSQGPRAETAAQRDSARVQVEPPSAADAGRTLSELVPVLPTPPEDGYDGRPSRTELARHVVRFNFLSLGLNVPVNPQGLPDNPVPSLLEVGPMENQAEAIKGILPHLLPGGAPPAQPNASWFRFPFLQGLPDRMELDHGELFHTVGRLDQCIALLKLERGKTLDQVVEELRKHRRSSNGSLPIDNEGIYLHFRKLLDGDPPAKAGEPPVPIMDPQVREASWTGLILLYPGMDFLLPGLRTFFQKIFGEPLRYLALTASVGPFDGNLGVGKSRYASVYGTLRYTDDFHFDPDADDGDPDSDADWDIGLVDIRFRDRQIARFEVHGEVLLRKFFKVKKQGSGGTDPKPAVFGLLGRYEAANAEGNPTGKDRVVIEGKARSPVTLDPDEGPVKQVAFERLSLYLEGLDENAAKGSRFAFDGNLTLRKEWWEEAAIFGSFIKPDFSSPIPFRKLGLPLPIGGTRLRWEYPSVEFPLAQQKPFRLGPISFGITRLGLTTLAEVLNGTIAIRRGSLEPGQRVVWIGVQVDLFKYPQLSTKTGQSLGLQLVAAVADDARDGFLGLRGLDFEKLDIDLFRFVRIRADEVKVSAGVPIEFSVKNASLEILGKKILDQLYFYLYEKDGIKGFAGFINEPLKINGFLQLHWLLLANGIDLKESAKVLLSLSDVPAKDIIEKIRKDCKDSVNLGPTSPVAGRWGFGLGFTLLGGVFTAKVLFVDGGVTGLMLKAPILEEIFGFPGFAVAYIRGATPEEDRFWLEFRVPKVATNAFNFLGGTIGITAYLNGGWELDIGFPWLVNGMRMWERGFCVQFGIFIGHAGFYVRYTHRSIGNQPLAEITVAGGYGVAVGLGVHFELWGGILVLHASIEIYGIIEGQITLRRGGNQLAGTVTLRSLPDGDSSQGIDPLVPADFTSINPALQYTPADKQLLYSFNGPIPDLNALKALATGPKANRIRTAIDALTLTGPSGLFDGGLKIVRLELTGTIGIIATAYGELNVYVLHARVEITLFGEAAARLAWAENEPLQLGYAFRFGAKIEASCEVGCCPFCVSFSFSRVAVLAFEGTIPL